MDEVYRTYRISVRLMNGQWMARVTHAKGGKVPVSARATQDEGETVCFERAREALDGYLDYLRTPAPSGLDETPDI